MADYLLQDDSRALEQKRSGKDGRIRTKGEKILDRVGLRPDATFGELVQGIEPVEQAMAAQSIFDEESVEKLKSTPACDILDGLLSIFER